MDARLAQLAQHPGYPAAMQHVPRTPAPQLFLYGGTLIAGGSVLAMVLDQVLAIALGSVLAALGLALVVIGVFFVRTPLERVVAAVIEQPSMGRFVALERLDGLKREYRARSHEIAVRAREANAGVAYLKAGFLLDFQPLR